jgi:hypothetical protein
MRSCTAPPKQRTEPVHTSRSRDGAPRGAGTAAHGSCLLASGRRATFSEFVIGGHEPPNAGIGVSRWGSRTAAAGVRAVAGPVAARAGGTAGAVVTASDVAAGAGRGVAGVVGRS